jgi:dienelactone hydrolase
MVAEGAREWALRVLDPAGEAVLARVSLPVHAWADRQVAAVLSDEGWWWLADAGGEGLVSVEVASGQVARWRPAGGERPHAWVVVHSAPARVVAVGSDGRGNEVVLLLEGEPDGAGQGGRLRVRHRVALPAGSQCLGVKDWESAQVLVAGESGEVGVLGPATAATRRGRRRARVRRIDLGDPGGDGEMAVGLYLPSGPVAATVVSLAPVPFTPGRGGGTGSAVMPLGSLEAWSHAGLLVRLGFAVADVTMRVPWWPELPDEQIRPTVAARIAAAVTATRLGEHVDVGALAVRGHSFAASLALIALADTGLFRTAIVVSGGYCRSMMPLGFQDEHRMLWEAQTVYRDFDAVLGAPRITHPVLILHGTDDSHPATPVSGAQVLFQALTALGTPARLVLLPGEGHTFLTREAVSAAVAEQAVWLRRWSNHPEAAPQTPGVLGQIG